MPSAPDQPHARERRWQRRLDGPLLAAALLTLPGAALYLAHPDGAWHTLAVGLSWLVWTVFLIDASVMLAVSASPGAWARSHRFELLVLVAAFPLLPLLHPNLYAFELLPALEVFKLVSAVKLLKAVRILRRQRRRR